MASVGSKDSEDYNATMRAVERAVMDDVRFYVDAARNGDSPETCARVIAERVAAAGYNAGFAHGAMGCERIMDERDALRRDVDLRGTPKPPCEFPLPGGRRCCECTGCHPTPEEQRAWLAGDADRRSIDWYVERLGERNADLRRLYAIRTKFGEPAILHAEVERLRAERDRLKAALERVESHGAGEAVRIAREALSDA